MREHLRSDCQFGSQLRNTGRSMIFVLSEIENLPILLRKNLSDQGPKALSAVLPASLSECKPRAN